MRVVWCGKPVYNYKPAGLGSHAEMTGWGLADGRYTPNYFEKFFMLYILIAKFAVCFSTIIGEDVKIVVSKSIKDPGYHYRWAVLFGVLIIVCDSGF
jgi:hypothetical protein